jgi:hypothetical protein
MTDDQAVISCADGTYTMDGFYMPDEWLIAPEEDIWRLTDRKWNISKLYPTAADAIAGARYTESLRNWNWRR